MHNNQRTLGGPLFKCSVHSLPTSSTNLQDTSITNEQEHNLENPCENSETTLLIILERNPYYLIDCSSHVTTSAQDSKVPKPEQREKLSSEGKRNFDKVHLQSPPTINQHSPIESSFRNCMLALQYNFYSYEFF